MDEKCGIGNSTNKSARKYDSKTNPSRSIKLIVVKD